MQKHKVSLCRRLANAFRFSCDGYKATFQDEPAFKQILIITVVLVVTAFILPLTALERVVLLLPLFISIIVELLNSAIENIVDMTSPEFHPLAKKAKDMGSAAQLTAMILIVAVWCLVLGARFL